MIKRIICMVLTLIVLQSTLIGCAMSSNDKQPLPTGDDTSLQIEATSQELANQQETTIPEETTKPEATTAEPKPETTVVQETSKPEVTTAEPKPETTVQETTKPEVTTAEPKPETTVQETTKPEVTTAESKPETTVQETTKPEVTTAEPKPETDGYPELTLSYLMPLPDSIKYQKNDTGIYENEYVKADFSQATKGYILVTYKDPWATNISVTLEETNAYSHMYEESHRFQFTREDLEANNNVIRIDLPETDAIYYFSVISTINEKRSIKIKVNIGQITVDGALSSEDMRPTEEMIKLTETKPGVYSNKYVSIDTNTASNGYIQLDYIEPNASQIEVRMTSDVISEYDRPGTWYCKVDEKGTCSIKLALTYGEAQYSIDVYSLMKNESNGITLSTQKAELVVDIDNVCEQDAFLLNTGEVIFDSDMMFIKKAEELAKGCENDFEVVAKIYDWVTDYIVYGGTEFTAVGLYSCDLDKVYEDGMGVCYDYAVVLAAMLRSQGIPCKVVFGRYNYSSMGHAWNEIYISSDGSITTDKISIEGNKWCTLDPTATSTAKGSVISTMNDPENYIWELYY